MGPLPPSRNFPQRKRDLLNYYARKLSASHFHMQAGSGGERKEPQAPPAGLPFQLAAPSPSLGKKYNFADFITVKFNYSNLASLYCCGKQGPGAQAGRMGELMRQSSNVMIWYFDFDIWISRLRIQKAKCPVARCPFVSVGIDFLL